MDNSAEYLLQFFQVEEAPEGFDSSLPQAFSRMMETQDVLNSLRDMQVSRLKIVEDIMPRIWENFGPPIPTIEVANIMVSVFHKYRRCRCLNLRQWAADVFGDDHAAIPWL